MTMNKMICAVVLACSAVTSGLTAFAQTAETDKQFLTKASQSDFTEIKFSQLALDKGSSPKVKNFAQKMIVDHQKLESEMKPYAEKAGISPVTELDAEHQQKYDGLSKLSGVDFDKTYMTGMAEDHHAALDLFKAEEGSATAERAFKSTLAKGKKIVAMHTKMADMALKRMGEKTSMKHPGM
jgi:putative membrane protein